MADDLRMRAEVLDRASKPLKDIQAALAAIHRTPGMDAATEWLGKFNEKATGFVKDGGGAAGVINAMGIGGLTAAASLAELVGHFKELSERTLAMKELGREVGLTVNQLNALNHAAASFGLAPDKMQAAINHFAGQMPQFMRGFGELHDELAKRFPELTKKLMGEGMQDQLKDIFNFLGQDTLQKDPQRQKQMAELFFGNGDDIEKLFAKGGDGFMKSVQEYAKTLEPVTAEFLKQSEELRKSLLAFNDALERIETKTGPTVLRGMNEVLGEFNTLFDNLDKLEKWWTENSPSKKAADVGNALDDQLTMNKGQLYDKYHGKGDFAPAGSADDANRRIASMQAELAALQASVKADKNPIGFGVRHANDYGRIRELSEAIKQLQDALMSGPAQKMSYRSGGAVGAMLQNASFGGFDEGGGGPVAAGTKAGVLAAFRELMADGASGAGGAPGITNASYSPGGGMGGVGGGGGSFGLGKIGRGRGWSETPDGKAGGVPGGMKARGLAAMRYLVEQKGWTPEGAAIAIGNAQQESGIQSGGRPGDGGMSQHMFQWNHDRLDRLNAFAAARGKSASDFYTNLDFMDEERRHRSGLERDWDKQHDLRNAGRLSHAYEGFGDNSTATREQNARNWLHEYQQGDHQKLGEALKGAARPPVHTGRSRRVLPPASSLSVPSEQPGLDISGTTKVDIHLHDPGKAVRRTALMSTGDVMSKLHRWPGMPIASDQA